MKTLLLFLLFTFSTIFCNAQKKIFVGPKAGYLSMSGFDSRGIGGLNMEVQVSKNFGFNYSLMFGNGYGHVPLGVPIGIVMAKSFTANRDTSVSEAIAAALLFSVLCAIIPEGISLHINMGDYLSLTPYLNPLQGEYIRNGGSNGAYYASFSLGTRLDFNFPKSKLRLSPHVEYKTYYGRNEHVGFVFGVSLMADLKGNKIAEPKAFKPLMPSGHENE